MNNFFIFTILWLIFNILLKVFNHKCLFKGIKSHPKIDFAIQRNQKLAQIRETLSHPTIKPSP